MEGIEQISSEDLFSSYVRVNMIDESTKKITYKYSLFKEDVTIYKKVNDKVWLSIHTVIDDKPYYFYKYVGGGVILHIEYIGDPSNKDYSLSTVEVSDGNKITNYIFDDYKVKVKPSPNLNDYPLEKAEEKRVSTVTIANDILTYQSQAAGDIDCYFLEGLSYSWWTIFGHKMKKAPCE
ncbi:hypothetical protein QNI16_19720 [Cytophagaceae bacterium YF14B1]|uniref:Uncharacterized protein n=1 Tax=Xanthocytophaga flava TaxID=3048013 RepID=A0AAE3QU90_9BACT|nr:hypothetical protein [Xanthocytophaga flavus]MDJ1482738.1 hypothetical protein [Xanthocytophaga flavus]